MRKRNDQQLPQVDPTRRGRFGHLSLGLVLLLGSPVLGQRVIYVNVKSAGGGDGTAWADAFIDLQDALDDAGTNGGCPCDIWVSEGWYKPDRGTGDRLMAFELASGVGLYGGFAGHEECREERDPAVRRTVLSGDLLDNDDPAFVPTSNCCYARSEEFGCDDPVCTEVVHGEDTTCVQSGWYGACSGIAAFLCCDLCRTPRCDNSFNVLRATQVDSTGVLDGFEVRGGEANGYPDDPGYGGGILVDTSRLMIHRCVFADNAAVVGAAVDSYSLGPFPEEYGAQITDCTFEENRAYAGPIVYNGDDFSGMVIKDCVFRANRGNALHVYKINPIENVQFIDNTGKGFLSGGTNTLKNCSFVRNRFGGMLVSSAYVLNCEFRGNGNTELGTELGSGGGINVSYSLLVVNSVFVGNSASAGGAIAGGFGLTTIINSTFVDNQASAGPGGGVALVGSGSVANSIFWGNNGGYGSLEEMQLYQANPQASLVINNSIVEGWTGALGGIGNSGSNPMFVDADGADDIVGTEDDDLRLSPGSPAINAGDPNASGLPSTDLDGHARVLCGRVDIGAYEFGIGDYNCDQSIDLSDFANWSACMTGPQGGPYDVGCEPFDFNADSAIDLLDFAAFIAALSGL